MFQRLFFILSTIFGTGVLVSFNTPSILELVNEWNKMTISSLETQFRMPTDNANKRKYKELLLTTPLYLGYIKGTSTQKSIRYGLIKDILSKKYRDFYILEANRSGEQVEIVSYLITMENKSAVVLIYDYLGGKWVLSPKTQRCIVKLSTDRGKQIVKWGDGVNKDDVILSKFIDGKIVSSEYYLDHTLSGINGIEKVLNLRSPGRKY
jgi:hypothetical protein